MRAKLCAAVFAAALLAIMLSLVAPVAWAAECPEGQHNYSEARLVPATAMEDGEVDYICTLCGQQYTKLLFATDHLWGEWVIDQKPTCTEPGKRHRTCTRTQPHMETAVIPVLGHKYKETRTEPTCLEPGKSVFVCVNDAAHTYEEPIPAPGSHSFGEWREETPAGQGTEGLEARSCVRCGLVETNVLEALPTTTTEPATTPPTEPPTEEPTEPPTEPERSIPVMDIVLISANTIALGWFLFLLIPYFLGLAFAKRRRKAQEERDALRKEVDELHGYE